MSASKVYSNNYNTLQVSTQYLTYPIARYIYYAAEQFSTVIPLYFHLSCNRFSQNERNSYRT